MEVVDDKTGDLIDRIEELEDALHRIAAWSEAYPTDMFHEPSPEELKRAHEVLKANGMGIDAISASAMRRALMGVGEIARGVVPK